MALQQTFDFLAEPPITGSGAANPAQNKILLIDRLRAQVGCIHTRDIDTLSTDHRQTFSTGSAAIDELLPRGGLSAEAITEWVAAADGCGAASLSLITAATYLQSPQVSGPLIVVSSPEEFYPPAAVALGIPADRVIWVRPTRQADAVWAIDQALRSKATAMVWALIGARLDDRDARRFQLAAEHGNTPGLFIRPAAVRGRPTFADIRFCVSSEVGLTTEASSARAMRITLDRCRGGQIGRSVVVQINDLGGIDRQAQPQRLQDEAILMHLATQLSQPQRTTGQRKHHA